MRTPVVPGTHLDPSPRSQRPGASPTTLLLRFAILGMTMFFAALLLAYLVMRLGRNPHVLSGAAGLHFDVPVWFWFSTLTVLVSSLSLWGAGRFAELDNPRLARRAYVAATGLGYVFLLLQAIGVTELFLRHRTVVGQHVGIYGVIFLLFGLHALHVLGGLIPLTRGALALARRPLDREHRATIQGISGYWHFLTLVWFTLWNVIILVD
ncbi:MAG: cytochrome c oxidase subunit 3 [Candidatus Eisenbacteria bacterium]|nr:cytochrome c oxidase subunit 3 [Candidatus Eisenbacteria bacterium]